MSQGYTTKHWFGQLGLVSGNTELGPDGHVSSVSAPNLTDTGMFCRLPDEFCRNVVGKPIHTVQSHQLYKLRTRCPQSTATITQKLPSFSLSAQPYSSYYWLASCDRKPSRETTAFNNNFTSCASFVWLWHKIYCKPRIIQKLSRVLNLSFNCAL